MTVMSFGRYRGRLMHELPTSYLEWLVRTQPRGDEIGKAAAHELRLRGRDVERLGEIYEARIGVRIQSPIPKEWQWAVQEIVKEGFVHASLKHHPDRGGTHDRMQELLVARNWLTQMLKLGDQS